MTTSGAPTGVAIKDLTSGTVITFTSDLTAYGAPNNNRRPGVHFIVDRESTSGYMMHVWDTQKQRRTAIMLDGLTLRSIRIVGNINSAGAE